MSQYQELTILDKTLTLLLISGVLIVSGCLIVLAVGTAINPAWLITGLVYTLPLMMVGILIIFLSAKLLEIMK